ncbi:MAG: di-trans,poly-cis-decaprenylcistransferase [Sulfurovaceae bacterium]
MQNRLNHLAIIMDGNGRWAQNRGLSRIEGHKKGADTVRNITIFCSQNDVRYLTLYAFSTENWKRPKEEVDFLMKLFYVYLKQELKTYLKYKIRFKVIGNKEGLSKKLQDTIQFVEDRTKHFEGLTQVLAINYGSRDEIIRAVQKLNDKDIEINEENFNNCLDTADMPDVDLLIRTSGEIRLSNYLLWQLAYAEMHFTNTYFPDFNSSELEEIIIDFQHRNRRFGKI